MNFVYLVKGMFYLLGFERLYNPDFKYIRVTETLGDITLMPVNDKDDDPESCYYSDISDPSFKEKMMQIFDRCDYNILAFVEFDDIYYSKLTHTIDFLDALKTCCDFREIDEVSVRVI
ncbi:hypothetical protein SAMN02910317_01965 [Ruminococcaceae bacterium FB2012]|nr:hypothetical protein SAMN02910317_01965 [Ruminococcaceae bacterium FB2012]